MCELCEDRERAIEVAKDEIRMLLNRENFGNHSDIAEMSEATVAGLIAVRCSIICAADTHASNDLCGAPASIILGSWAGIALEAEAMQSEIHHLISGLFGSDNPGNLN